jgi:hypothetical protein
MKSVLTTYHLKERDAEADEQISYDRAALLYSRGHHGFHGSNLIEATVNAKTASRVGGIEPSLDTCRCGVIQFSEDSKKTYRGPTDITVNRSLVDRIIVPYDRVDELYEAPEPVQTINKQVPTFQATSPFLRTRISTISYTHTFKMPVEGNGTQYDTNEREGCIELIWRKCHRRS